MHSSFLTMHPAKLKNLTPMTGAVPRALRHPLQWQFQAPQMVPLVARITQHRLPRVLSTPTSLAAQRPPSA